MEDISAYLLEHPLSPVVLEGPLESKDRVHRINDLAALLDAIPTQTKGFLKNYTRISISLSPDLYDIFSGTQYPGVSPLVFTIANRRVSSHQFTRDKNLSSVNVPTLPRDRASIKYLDSMGGVVAETYAEWVTP